MAVRKEPLSTPDWEPRGSTGRRMPLHITFDELLRYTGAERGRWRAWFAANPHAMDLPIQPGGRLGTAGKVIDHIFLAEQRQLQRLTGLTPSDATGLTGNNAGPLFDYGASVRRELEQFASDLDEELADEIRTVEVQGHTYAMTARKLLFHILLHEIRHWAQIVLAVRQAGLAPPGDHDLFHSDALR